MRLRLACTIITASMLLLQPAMATSTAFNSFKSRYPNNPLSSSLSCSVCHESGDETSANLRPYGLALLDQRDSGKSWANSILAVETIDSDGDGFGNRAEILLGFDPSSDALHPVRTPAQPEWSLYE